MRNCELSTGPAMSGGFAKYKTLTGNTWGPRTVLPNPLLRRNNGPASWMPWAWFTGTIVLAAAALFDRLGALPIDVWDEARLANNALEMAQTGLSLTTMRFKSAA